MSWFVLILAGLFEVGWTLGLKYTAGFTRIWPTVGTVTAMAISLALLGIALKDLPVGTVLLGIFLFGESAALNRLLYAGLILAGIYRPQTNYPTLFQEKGDRPGSSYVTPVSKSLIDV